MNPDTAVASESNAPVGRLKANRLFAACWDWLVSHEGKAAREMRAEIVGTAAGRVLEIGCGTGASFPYYSADAHVVATDPDSHMLKRAQRRAEELGLSSIELRQAPAEQLPFDDASFDHVVSCWVLCHVDDQARALAEVRRLLRAGGTFRFMDHVRSDSGPGGALQSLVDPLWSRLLGAGCHVNRRTQQAIEEAGFKIEWLKRARLTPPTTPGIYGVARVA